MNRKIITAAMWLPTSCAFAQSASQIQYQQALEQARQGQTELAARQLQQLANEHPRRKKYQYDYLQVLLWAGRNEEVMQEAEKINLKKAPGYVLETIAKAARNLKQYDQATQLYLQATKKLPDRLTPKLGLGLILLDQNHTQAAIAHFAELSRQFPDNPELLEAQALAFEQDKQFELAGDYFRKLLKQQPVNGNAAMGLLRSQAATANYAAAVDTANTYRQLLGDEKWAGVHWDFATWLIQQGELVLADQVGNFTLTDQALALLSSNLAALPGLSLTNANAWLTRAESDRLVALHDRKRFEDVAAHFQRLRQTNAALPLYAQSAAANAYLELNQAQSAQEIYLNIIRQQPDNFTALLGLARTSLNQQAPIQLDTVLPQMSQLVEANPDKPNYRYDYLRMLQWSGRNRAALEQGDKIDLNKAPAYVLETLAKAARETNDFPRAEKLYLQAKEKDPGSLNPRLGLGLLLLDQHKSRQAARYFDDLAIDNHEDIAVMLAQANAHEMAGQPKQASRIYQSILHNQPQHKPAAQGLIRTLAKCGQYGKALKFAQQYRSFVSDDQWAELNWQHASALIRQGQAAREKNPGDFKETDQAIAAIQNNLKSLARLNLDEKPVWRTRAHADLLVALRDRQRFSDLDQAYQNALRQNIELPDYALLAVADSRMNNQQPEQAAEVYLHILQHEPEHFDALLGLTKAYQASGQLQKIDPVLAKLQTVAAQNPSRTQYQYDVMQLLSWLGKDADVVRLARMIDMSAAPDNILEMAARSARNTQDFQLANKLYALAAEKRPDSLSPQLGLAGLLMDKHDYAAAIDNLKALRLDYPQNVELIQLQAHAHRYADQPEKAAEFYAQALQLAPDRPEALRGRAFSLADANQAEQALQLANAKRELFSDDEWAGLKWAYAGQLIRQGEQALSLDARDYRLVDQAINELHQNIDLTEHLQLHDPVVWRQRAEFDLLVALRDRRRMQDAIDLYQQLSAQNVVIPHYARMAAGDAYLNNRLPAKARDLYLGVLTEKPDYFNAKVSLAYAYLEAEQLDLALNTAERLAKEEPETLLIRKADDTEISVTNPQKATADMTVALFHAYLDDLQGAQIRLQDLHRQHPDDINIHTKLAEVYYFRGWPRRAKQELNAAAINAPQSFGIKLNQARVAHELRDFHQEENLTHELYSYFPEDSGALKQMQAWKKHNKPEFKLFASGGLSQNHATETNPVFGNDNIAIDGYLYSTPLQRDFRLFTHEGWRTGLFNETEGGRGYLRIYGAGLEYAHKNLLASAEVHYDNFRSDAVGVDLGLDYQLDDQWNLFTRLSSLDNTISLRALSYKDDPVKAQSARIGAGYRVNESRQYTVSGKYTHFNDENNRFELDAVAFERWYSGPIYKFATFLNAGYSANSNPANQGVYFSPDQDVLVSVTLDNDWLTYRHYETDFHQHLSLTAGGYWQDSYRDHPELGSFGINPVGSIGYEHRWHLGRDVELNYGAAKSWRYYDDALTDNWQFFLNADVRF